MRFACVALLTVLLTGTVDAAESLDPVLYAEIQRLAATLTDGFAMLDQADSYPGAKGTRLADHSIVVMAFSGWGGGNGSVQFMALFRHNDASFQFPDGNRARPYQLLGVVQIGDDSDRWFKTVEVRGDRVLLSGRRWAKGDAHCCPSLDARAAYRISERGINEATR